MKPIERISVYLKFKNISPHSFERKVGLSNGYFAKQKKNGSMGSNILEKIHHQYKMLDIKWILTGEGEMLIHSYQVLEASQEARVNESI